MKKWLFALAIVVSLCLLSLLLIPSVFHERIEDAAKREINNRIDGTLTFAHLDISLLSNFPNITVTAEKLKAISKRFPNDPLLDVEAVEFVIDSREYFFEQHIDLLSINIQRPIIDAHFAYNGTSNFSILKPDTTTAGNTEEEAITLHLKELRIENADFFYHDEYAKTNASFLGLNFFANGEFSSDVFELAIKSNSDTISLIYEDKPYYQDKKFSSDVLLKIDRRRNVFEVLRSEILVNNFPFALKGKISLLPSKYNFDLTFDSPRTTFQELLSLASVFQNRMDGITSDGKISFNGFVKGDYIPGTDSIPNFNVRLEVKDGSFKMNTVKDSIKDIHLDLMVSNNVGLFDSTEFEMDSIFLRIQEHAVQGHAHVHRLTNSVVDAALTGSLHVEEILEVYPFPGVNAEGELNFNFEVEGNYSKIDANVQLPHIDFDVDVSHGKLKYDSLPDSLSNITFHMAGHSPRGNWRDGKIEIEQLKMNVGDDPINGRLTVENFIKPVFDGILTADIHLEDILRIFPLDSTEMKGRLKAVVKIKGLYDSEVGAFPTVDADFSVKDGYLKLPEYPDPLEDVNVTASIRNKTGKIATTILNIEQLAYKMAGESFTVRGKISDFENYAYDMSIKGSVDLGRLTSIYAIDDWKLSGKVSCDLELKGKISDLKKGLYDKTEAIGYFQFQNLTIDGRRLPQALVVSNGKIKVSPETLFLEDVNVRTGHSRLKFAGEMQDYFCFFKDDGDLVTSTLKLDADTVDLNEWKLAFVSIDRDAPSVVATSTTKHSAWQVPRSIDFHFDSDIKFLQYEDMRISDLLGEIIIKDGVMSMKETGFNSLNARFAANGTYDSRVANHPTFDFHLNIEELDIQKAYKEIKLVRELLPAAADAEGMFSINYKIKGELDSTMFPMTATLVGGGDMHIAEAKINGMKVFERLSKAAKKNEMNDPHLKDFTMTTEIRNNKVFVRPFNVKVSGLNTEIEGVNDLGGTVQYVVKVQLLPFNKLRIPFNVSGTYDNPKVAIGKGHKLPDEGLN